MSDDKFQTMRTSELVRLVASKVGKKALSGAYEELDRRIPPPEHCEHVLHKQGDKYCLICRGPVDVGPWRY